jgi:hypothetical protein
MPMTQRSSRKLSPTTASPSSSPAGFIEKAQALQMSAQAKPFKDVVMKDLRVRQLTPDCVILAYHGQGSRDGDEKPFQGSVCSAYIKRDGRWQLALTAHQPWKPDTGTVR